MMIVVNDNVIKEVTMVDFKKMNLQTLGHLALLGIVILVIVSAIIHVVNPFLITIGLVKAGLTVTDTLLLLLAIKFYAKD